MKETIAFTYVTAEYRCTECSATRSDHASTLSKPYFVAAFVAAVPLFVALLLPPWDFPWYYFFSILAGEVLLLFMAGFVGGVLTGGAGGGVVRRCPSCKGTMTFRGRHFTESRTPRWTDCVLFILFVALNVLVWLALRHQPGG